MPTDGSPCYSLVNLGRPAKLDDLTAKRIVDAIAAGQSRRGAAQAARIGDTTLFRWLAEGRDEDSPYREFRERVMQAESKAERAMVDCLFEAAKAGKFQAAQFWLERRRVNDWYKPEAEPESARDAEQVDDDESMTESVLAAIRSRKVGT